MTNIQKKLDNYITAEMAYWDFSGVIRIVQKGAVLYETSRGYANIAFGIKYNANAVCGRFGYETVHGICNYDFI